GADGRGLRRLTERPNRFGYVYPAWSPDGRTIAFSDDAGGVLEVFTVGADGRGLRQRSRLGGSNLYPAWSPDGQRLTFRHFAQEGSGGVWGGDASGRDPGPLRLPGSGDHVEGGRLAWRPAGPEDANGRNPAGAAGAGGSEVPPSPLKRQR